MESKEIIKAIMAERGFSQSGLARKLGDSRASGVTERLRSGGKDLNLDTLIKFLDALDCELVVRSKLKDKGEWKVGDRA